MGWSGLLHIMADGWATAPVSTRNTRGRGIFQARRVGGELREKASISCPNNMLNVAQRIPPLYRPSLGSCQPQATMPPPPKGIFVPLLTSRFTVPPLELRTLILPSERLGRREERTFKHDDGEWPRKSNGLQFCEPRSRPVCYRRNFGQKDFG